MSKKFRKVLAAVLAATMVLGSGVVANADEGSGTGDGDLVQVEHPDVFNVILPVDNGKQFNYILDPTGVIEKTKYEQFGGTASASFTGSGNVWFENTPATESAPRKFTNESDPATAYNKSNIDVEISVEAKLATPSGIVIATDSTTIPSAATPSMYLAMKATESNGNSKTDAITVAGVTATSSIASASNAYETRYVNGKYVNQLNATASGLKKEDATFGTYFKSYSFVLTGECSPNGDWKKVTDNPPTVSLVWTIEMPDGAVDAENGPTISVANDGLITMSGLTADKNYASASITDQYGVAYPVQGSDGTWIGDGTTWSSTDGGTLQLQLGTAWMNALRGTSGKITLTLTDGTSIEAPISIS